MKARIKVDGKTGNLGSSVVIRRSGDRLTVTTTAPMAKRYMKYLSKKYLKKQQLRDFIRVVAVDKQTYEFRYFNISE